VKRKRPIEFSGLGAFAHTWLARGDAGVLSERHLRILEAVRAHGSLNAAAKHLHISYRDAWEKVRQAEAALELRLIAARVGGARGGGSSLTAAGEDLVARLRAFHDEQRAAVARAAARHFGRRAVPAARRRGGNRLRLATTTSLVDTGLLASVLEPFTERFGIAVDVLPVGSGAALTQARTGKADVVLTHAPDSERQALEHGDVVNPRPVMRNAFAIVGPHDDPAGVRGARSVRTALRRIAAAAAPFLSRADRSGTHQRERALFAAAGITPGAWYRRHRMGMAALLRRAEAIGAYTLADRGTFAALAGELSLVELYSDERSLGNTYSVLATNPQQHGSANYRAAMALIGWLTSPAVQDLITHYRVAGRRVAQPALARRRR